ncbi:hypothetical protein CAPTEDRAFT_197670 [Capitella teleta]|uniref:DDE-1 domain-containing protein n=1 Tax=Capitella teleta TaxID=283909 RepID=R7VHC5_CAPTE|nr:hypothetical protein CAPTEDRAFT_197670 [Capitella teleta]|eukprot:ELU18029.1 hypothetical protein CAPTEDRAFT_197670 [Capitella teleta]
MAYGMAKSTPSTESKKWLKKNPLFEVGLPPETRTVCHPSGWMQMAIFLEWFEHFIHHAKPSKEEPILLIFDGHATHTKNLALIETARDNNVHILVIPPHTSHCVQPLDVAFMGPLNTFYEQEVRMWLRNHPGQVITIYQVGSLFGKAYQRAATSSNAVNGFAKSGICPLNPYIFGEELFEAAATTDRPAPEVAAQSPEIGTSMNTYSSSDIERPANPQTPEPATTPEKEISVNNSSRSELQKKKDSEKQQPKIKRTKIQPFGSGENKKQKDRPKKKTSRKPIKRKSTRSNEEETDKDVPCLYCSGMFSESRSNATWIQCGQCRQWAHEECAGTSSEHFVCEMCED